LLSKIQPLMRIAYHIEASNEVSNCVLQPFKNKKTSHIFMQYLAVKSFYFIAFLNRISHF
jgi:hypothetical protein